MSVHGREGQPKRKPWSCCLAAAAAFVAVLGLVLAVWVMGGRAELRRANAKLKAARIPTTMDELVPRVPQAENAAILYEKAWKRLGTIPPDIKQLFTALLKSPPKTWAQDQKTKLQVYVEGHREVIELCRRAAQRPRCRFAVDYMALAGPPIDHMISMGGLAELLTLDCYDHVARGETEGALDSAFLGMALARDCAADPFFIGRLTQFGNYQISYRALDSALIYGDLSLALLERLLARLDGASPETSMKTTVNAEMCLMLALFRDPNRAYAASQAAGGQAPGPWAGSLSWIYDGFFAPRDEACYIELALRCMEHAADPYHKAKGEFRAIDAAAARRSWMHPISSITAFGLTAGANRPASAAEAQHQLRRLAVALMVHQKKYSSLPTNLDHLVPEIVRKAPIDPFSGKPYVYRREGAGFVVYSLGEDMQDDKGVPRQAGSDKGDIVFRFAAKP